MWGNRGLDENTDKPRSIPNPQIADINIILEKWDKKAPAIPASTSVGDMALDTPDSKHALQLPEVQKAKSLHESLSIDNTSQGKTWSAQHAAR